AFQQSLRSFAAEPVDRTSTGLLENQRADRNDIRYADPVRAVSRWRLSEVPQVMTFDYGEFSFASKEEMLEKSREFWNPGKTDFWVESGVPLVIDRREDYFIYDMSGKRLLDVHLNGGTYSLGHRNAEVVQAVTAAMSHFDIGNHH